MGVLERISSFSRWPLNSTASPLSLANAGFMYTGERDKVRCPICRLEIAGCSEVSSHEQSKPLHPKDEHRLRSPQCKLAIECSKPDSEIITALRNKFWQCVASSDDVVGQTSSKPLSNEVENFNVFQTEQKPSENMREVLKHALDRALRQVSDCEKPEVANNPAQRIVVDRTNPDYNLLKAESARLSTYYDWPCTAPVKPEELAADGFFFTGRTDRVCCAFCRGILIRWSPGDAPSVEHRRHFPDCPFVKGQNVGNVPANRGYSFPATVSLKAGSSNSAERISCMEIGRSCSIAHATVTGSNASISECGKPSQAQQPSKDVTISESAANELSVVSDDDEQQLLTENQRLMETVTCKVCLDRAVNTVFLPCGHLVSCEQCSPRLRNCPICRTYIRGTVKTFLS